MSCNGYYILSVWLIKLFHAVCLSLREYIFLKLMGALLHLCMPFFISQYISIKLILKYILWNSKGDFLILYPYVCKYNSWVEQCVVKWKRYKWKKMRNGENGSCKMEVRVFLSETILMWPIQYYSFQQFITCQAMVVAHKIKFRQTNVQNSVGNKSMVTEIMLSLSRCCVWKGLASQAVFWK